MIPVLIGSQKTGLVAHLLKGLCVLLMVKPLQLKISLDLCIYQPLNEELARSRFVILHSHTVFFGDTYSQLSKALNRRRSKNDFFFFEIDEQRNKFKVNIEKIDS